ncbi:unnamed protein product [Auanema sp. JU1783]|nr:unnamed protein product [Auanema sp. JU1783]
MPRLIPRSLFIFCLIGLAFSADTHDLDEDHRMLAQKAADHINAQSNDLFLWALADVDDVHRHILTGVKYTVKFTLAKTDCTKQNGKLSTEGCSQGNRLKKCTAEILRKSWENFEGVHIIGCEEPFTRSKRHSKVQLKSSNFVLEELRDSRHIKSKDYVAWNRFLDFADRHNKQYESKRHAFKRFRVFKRNLKSIDTWQKREMGTAVYGVTQFSDMTSSEFKKTYLPYLWDLPVYPNKILTDDDMPRGDIPEFMDWREKGAVTGVKNQGSCGSCWAFSTTGNVEGQWFLSKGKLVSLSEQQLVDCDHLDQGCNGGLPSNAYKEIMNMGGLEPEDKYPYDAKDETCHLSRPDISVYINDSVELPKNEESMKAYLVHNGPISIGMFILS